MEQIAGSAATASQSDDSACADVFPFKGIRHLPICISRVSDDITNYVPPTPERRTCARAAHRQQRRFLCRNVFRGELRLGVRRCRGESETAKVFAGCCLEDVFVLESADECR